MEYCRLDGDTGRLRTEIKHPRLLLFNPGHEMVPEIIGKKPYVPPPVVRTMMRDLGLLPAWLTKSGQDYVFCPEETLPIPDTHPLKPEARLLQIPDTALPSNDYTLDMWGQSPVWLAALQHRFPWLSTVSAPHYPHELYQRSHRSEATRCLEAIGRGEIAARWFTSVDDFLGQKQRYFPPDSALLAKLPSSSSGRGLLWLGASPTESEIDLLTKALRCASSFSVEPVLDVRQDWAAEFYSDGKGRLDFVGWSRFDTNKRGAYLGNRLATQTDLTAELTEAVGAKAHEEAITSVRDYLRERFATLYTGYIGVDMAVYAQEDHLLLHPCIEINVRYTMGVAAILLYDLRVESGRKGLFEVKSFRSEGEAHKWNSMMQRSHPPLIMDGRLRTGYLPLTITDRSSRFLAYLLITEDR
ncbi:hypothetical protein [Porphyromonas gulae]|uniref:hypothetical protein n=1 Tax=Porphyromonas gulae TaxID=111105 RepID=UPI0026EEFC70|nr:hypothetical protein [Porphyromonas gulae]